jgi:hypothetical protein
MKQIECCKCGSKQRLLVQERVDNDTGRVIDKNFICADCAGVFKDAAFQKDDVHRELDIVDGKVVGLK